jgi:hypothetical protein
MPPDQQLATWLALSFQCSNRGDPPSAEDLELCRGLAQAMIQDPQIQNVLSFAAWYDHAVDGNALPPGITEADLTHRAAQDYARISHVYSDRGHWRVFVALLCWEVQSTQPQAAIEEVATLVSQFYAMASARGFHLEEDDEGVQDAFARSFLTWLTNPDRNQRVAVAKPTSDRLAQARAARFGGTHGS